MNIYTFDHADIQLRERTPSAELLAIHRRIRVEEHVVSAVVISPAWLIRADGSEATLNYEVDPRHKVLIQLWSRRSFGAILRGDGVSLIGDERYNPNSGPLRLSRAVQGYSVITIGVKVDSAYSWNNEVSGGSNVISATARIVS